MLQLTCNEKVLKFFLMNKKQPTIHPKKHSNVLAMYWYVKQLYNKGFLHLPFVTKEGFSSHRIDFEVRNSFYSNGVFIFRVQASKVTEISQNAIRK